MLSRMITTALAAATILSSTAAAQDALNVSFMFNGAERAFVQGASPDVAQVLSHFKTSPTCDGPCLAPLRAAADVDTIGEREVISFVTDLVATGGGLLVDSRSPTDRADGFITASVNIPGALLQPENPFLNDILQAMGARSFQDTLNFADALPLVVFDDGPSTQDAPNLINTLLALGYPAEKINYYRGGMLVWTALGLNTEDAKS